MLKVGDKVRILPCPMDGETIDRIQSCNSNQYGELLEINGDKCLVNTLVIYKEKRFMCKVPIRLTGLELEECIKNV